MTYLIRTLVAMCFAIVLIGQAISVPSSKPSMAPLNPKFSNYVSALERGIVPNASTRKALKSGLIPVPLNLSHLKNQRLATDLTAASVPSSFDLRNWGRVTAVRDQGDCGACWTFASIASLESALAPAEITDFSENNLKNLHGFDALPCSGGNYLKALAYLTRWSGPVVEWLDPYAPFDYSTSPVGLAPARHLQNAFIIAGRIGSLDNDLLKSAIMNYGALYVSMYFDEDYAYDFINDSYYYPFSSDTNHAVALVGWNDSYSRYNFEYNNVPYYPAGDGAFLVKNSYGQYWGNSGYFWVSYYDMSFARDDDGGIAFAGNENITNYNRVYQYDPLGWTNSWGFYGNTACYANVFTAVAMEDLKAISTYACSTYSSYVANIYTGVKESPTSGTLAATFTGTFQMAGYHTLVVPNPVFLDAGQRFSVVLRLTTPGDNYPIPVESYLFGYSSAAAASPGQSYMSSDGVSWTDAATMDKTMNVAIKAFTRAAAARKRRGQTISSH
jgi:C1A family cysteine protease